MPGEYRQIDIPVLLAPSYDSATSTTSDAEKFRYLTHVLVPPSSTVISDLEHAVLDAVRVRAERLKVPPDSNLKATIYQLVQPIRPVASETRVGLAKAFEIVNERYLEENARDFYSGRLLAELNLENLVAVLDTSIITPAGPTLTTVQEVNESSAQLRREHIATAAKKRKSPSTGAHTADRIVTQNPTRVDAVYNYRPIDLAPPPITLYHPVFAKFLQLMVEPQIFSDEELNNAQSFITLAVAYYKEEAIRKRKLQLVMGAAVHKNILVSEGLSYTYTRWLLDHYAIHEVKLEIGDGGSDPIAQGECVYVAIYSSNEARFIREACCCPAFIIGMAGPNIIVSGAVFVDQLVAQTLTDYISVVPRPSQDGRSPLDDAGYRVARLFRALKTCIIDLDEYYSELVQNIYPLPAPPIAGVLGQNVVLTYKSRLIPEISMKAVFIAEAKSESETATVVVKFAYTYNQEAHNLLATASPQQAPKLRYCAYEASVRMQVVVMDYIEGREVDDVLTQPAHIESLRWALTKLHADDFVFGDLRAPNVLIVDDRVVLVDFDWCGKAGEARYPSDIALGTSMWHSGVERGGLVEKAHDEYHFRALTKEDL
ncbi:hypothetical protein B0H21DRAFT_708046 [Amylocystis lapponica]|nr:hypothetical protein B0H21DRAFT_708046 [Amylocystis lapponica]